MTTRRPPALVDGRLATVRRDSRHGGGAVVRAATPRQQPAPAASRACDAGRLGVAIMLALALLAPGPPLAARTLTGAEPLAAVYDAIFDARFADVPPLLTAACGPASGPTRAPPPAPREACQLLEAVSIWWQIQLDPDDTARDASFEGAIDDAITGIDAWTKREPNRAEAWFYLGGAYGARAQWRVLRGERIAAARDGKRIKDALERSLALDRSIEDAFFGIGLYHYYADVAPAAAKMLRWLLFLPGGDRVAGMAEMQRARRGGQLLRDEADYQLHVLYLWYERQPERALELLDGLNTRHPSNPHFLQRIAEVQDAYLHDATSSLRAWTSLLDAARRGRLADAAAASARAHLGAALQLDRLHETDLALDHLRTVIAARPIRPSGALAQAHLQLGAALDRLGHRAEAQAAYRAAITGASTGDPLKIAERARAGLRRTPDAEEARAYTLSIEGWRAVERNALGDAATLLGQSLALRPDDQVTRYRQARLFLAQRDTAAALAAFDAITTRPETAPTFYASACVEAARLHERQGNRERALELYGYARDVFGADPRTKAQADRAIARLDGTAPAAPR